MAFIVEKRPGLHPGATVGFDVLDGEARERGGAELFDDRLFRLGDRKDVKEIAVVVADIGCRNLRARAQARQDQLPDRILRPVGCLQ